MNEPTAPVEPAVTEPVVPIRTSRRDPAATRQRWADRVQRFRDSDLSVPQFCRAEGVSVPAFYFWRRTLAAEGATEPRDQPTVVPVRIARPAPAVEVVLPSGAVLRFSADCDPDRVAALLRAVGAIPC
jgi:transposase-like protein